MHEMYNTDTDDLYHRMLQPIDIQEPLLSLCESEVRVESRILIRIDIPTKILCVRCDPKKTLFQVLQPIVEKFK
ncbi:unnamed protein product [Rotaria sordida]|uniref:Uncharacterized protein n=1 Tax=Rotaria sordida TaxID=392033 RepID=A0A819SWP9_9BILA|nr:unnamed protein product [Rotaria sordida]